nr:immunoglobulin heavy chain junction region [Macaca mulatta]MOV53333.1 immunoglobulin heavy chain junction region [Macaca mulatta]MOV53443.1 immunoglobulin heavy chain junction region [Macaca mulatta]MOV53517.1 immunoglobulin heavy chain junction region [Macaca mulatta]MOV53547.1 immunoglobulin heavy chain junction region [Macaca mulatta]
CARVGDHDSQSLDVW